MFGRLMPREGRFFDFFNDHADQLVQGARELRALMDNVKELPDRKRSIEKIEHRADKITQQTMQLLHASPRWTATTSTSSSRAWTTCST
jgi:uncharacterized protein